MVFGHLVGNHQSTVLLVSLSLSLVVCWWLVLVVVVDLTRGSYYPFYAAAPFVVSESLLLSKKLSTPIARGVAAVVFAGLVLWAMAGFNLDTSYMVMEPYGCRGTSRGESCEASWALGPFGEDLGSMLVCTVAAAALLVACSTKPTFASVIGSSACPIHPVRHH